jgi:hypothetical protein
MTSGRTAGLRGSALLPTLGALRDAIGRHLVDVPTPDLPGLQPLIVDAIEHSRLVDIDG